MPQTQEMDATPPQATEDASAGSRKDADAVLLDDDDADNDDDEPRTPELPIGVVMHNLYTGQSSTKDTLSIHANLDNIASWTETGNDNVKHVTYGTIGNAMWSGIEAMTALTYELTGGLGTYKPRYDFAVRSSTMTSQLRGYFDDARIIVDKHGVLGVDSKAGTTEFIPAVDIIFGDMRGWKAGDAGKTVEPGPAVDVLNYVSKYSPKIIIAGVPDGKCPEILAKLAEMANAYGYDFAIEKIKLQDTGTSVTRTEQFFVAVRRRGVESTVTPESRERRLAFRVEKFLEKKLPLPELDPDLFLESETFFIDDDAREPKKKKGSEAWKEDHMYVYNHNKVDWPAKPDEAFLQMAHKSRLNERQIELLFIITKKLEPSPERIYLNLAKNIMTVNFDDEKDTPWCTTVDIPLTASSGAPTVWHQQEERLLVGAELMRFLGMEVQVPFDDPDYESDQTFFGNLANSTYSVFGLATIMMAVLVCADTSALVNEMVPSGHQCARERERIDQCGSPKESGLTEGAD